MERYVKPQAELIRFRVNDVISASGEETAPTQCPVDIVPGCPSKMPCILTPIIPDD